MKLIASKYLIPKGFVGITFYPFIIVRDTNLKQDLKLLNHEKIHLRQQAEMLILPFYCWYIIEFTVKLIKYRDRYIAYRNISFEREAYTNEADPNYLCKRKLWSFINFL